MNTVTQRTQNEAIERAIAHFGSLSAMARGLGLSSPQVIQSWRKLGRVPPEHCPEVEKATGEKCELLNNRIDWGFLRGTTKIAA